MEKNIATIENRTKFDEMLCASINEVLVEMLGEKGANSIYYFAENGYGITKNEFAKDVQKFQTLLRDMFKFGAVLLEQKIMEKLYSKVKVVNQDIMLEYKNFDDLDFINYISSLKTAFDTKPKQVTIQ
ncbi:MAG: hypothetical protein IAX21_02400 [Candidatus Bathyarchaeota archaeon]|nr:hypothetical protein [Candidatus Bathyarchaeum tardum]WGM90130.1 MAG: hypothetical protein NUK63_03180 [Candidatus Bathyarchaeum tardum]WNZ29736.1 MAG: hypothetical protein IAX21_02400 [Candidatus Bathyarchaeota archaeon]